MSHTAYWPWPPDCLTCRPWPVGLAGERLAQRHPQRRPTSTSTPYRLRSRSSSTSTCASPMHHSTSWWVSELCSSRSVGSSATSRPRPWDELVLVGLGLAPRSATGSSGSGISHGSISSGSSLAESVSPVSARVSLATAQMSPAMHCGDGALRLAQRRGERADPLVDVVVLVAAVGRGRARRRARSRPGAGCRRRPGPGEIRPTYGSVVVLTTSATSGPSGSQVSGPARLAVGAWSPAGTSCSSGDGKAWVITSSSSAVPEAGRRGGRPAPGRTSRARPPSRGRR